MAEGAYAQGQLSAEESIPRSTTLRLFALQTNDAEPPVSAEGSVESRAASAGQDTPYGMPAPGKPVIGGLASHPAWEVAAAAFEVASDENADASPTTVDFSYGPSHRHSTDLDFRAWTYDSVYTKAVTNDLNGNLVAVQIIPGPDEFGGNSGSGAGKANNVVVGSGPSEQQATEDLLDQPRRLLNVNPNLSVPEPNLVALTFFGGLLMGWRRFDRTRRSPQIHPPAGAGPDEPGPG
jgi:hypothetical protein